MTLYGLKFFASLAVIFALFAYLNWRWQATINELEESKMENQRLWDQIHKLNRALSDARTDYENLRHSWPYSEDAEAERKGPWLPEITC